MLAAPTIYSTHMFHYYPAQMSQPFYYYPIGQQADQHQPLYHHYQQSQHNYSHYQYLQHYDSHNHQYHRRQDHHQLQSPTYNTSLAQAQYQHMNAAAFVRLNAANKINGGESNESHYKYSFYIIVITHCCSYLIIFFHHCYHFPSPHTTFRLVTFPFRLFSSAFLPQRNFSFIFPLFISRSHTPSAAISHCFVAAEIINS